MRRLKGIFNEEATGGLKFACRCLIDSEGFGRSSPFAPRRRSRYEPIVPITIGQIDILNFEFLCADVIVFVHEAENLNL